MTLGHVMFYAGIALMATGAVLLVILLVTDRKTRERVLKEIEDDYR